MNSKVGTAGLPLQAPLSLRLNMEPALPKEIEPVPPQLRLFSISPRFSRSILVNLDDEAIITRRSVTA